MSSNAGTSLDGIDPVTFQIIKHRLARVTDEAVEALKRVSGAPNTNEGHDLMVALYTSEGDLLTGGVGFLHHYLGASEATKHVIDEYGDDVEAGDKFVLNDPYTAALHPPDVYVISPIFYDGELQAFSASFVHVADIGAADPGGFSPTSTSVFHEGFQTPGIKLIEGGEMRQDVLNTILNMSRDPGMVELDLRSEIAANNVANDRLRELMAEYGPDTVERVGQQLIRQSRSKFRKRLRELPDGEWQARQYVDSPPEDRSFKVQVTLRKEGESLTFDFAGTDEQSEYGLNCTLTATVGGVFAPVFPLLCWDMTWNDGIIDVVDVEAPEGTIVNATRPAPISIATVATLQVCNNLSTLAVSKMLGSSERYADRATGVWHGAHAHVMLEIAEGGRTQVEALTDTFAGAGGARAFADGVDLGGEIPNIVARWGNAERHEAVLPLLYLYRQFVADSGGPGRYRGGVGHEYAVTPVTDEFDSIDLVTFGRAVEVPASEGTFGGHPGSTVEYSFYRDVGLDDDDVPFPPPPGALDGNREDGRWGVAPLDDDDVFYLRFPGSGGYGDPLERDPEDVAADVADGKVSPESARNVYGVPVDDEGHLTGSVEDAREEIRAERIDTAADGDAVSTPNVEGGEPTGLKLAAALAVIETDGGERYARCTDCETVLASAVEDWKDAAAVRERPLSDSGRHHDGSDDFCLREFACPDCGHLLDVEVSHREDGHLTSRLL
ncbi:MAG: hydantoinase B/oxoprolinase family protein [Haloplanus sp.]